VSCAVCGEVSSWGEGLRVGWFYVQGAASPMAIRPEMLAMLMMALLSGEWCVR
jgi:hypothetical protein